MCQKLYIKFYGNLTTIMTISSPSVANSYPIDDCTYIAEIIYLTC